VREPQALEAAGRPAEAIPHVARVRQLAGLSPTGLGELARAYAAAGREADGREALTTLLGIARARYVDADLVARAYEALNSTNLTRLLNRSIR